MIGTKCVQKEHGKRVAKAKFVREITLSSKDKWPF